MLLKARPGRGVRPVPEGEPDLRSPDTNAPKQRARCRLSATEGGWHPLRRLPTVSLESTDALGARHARMGRCSSPLRFSFARPHTSQTSRSCASCRTRTGPSATTRAAKMRSCGRSCPATSPAVGRTDTPWDARARERRSPTPAFSGRGPSVIRTVTRQFAGTPAPPRTRCAWGHVGYYPRTSACAHA